MDHYTDSELERMRNVFAAIKEERIYGDLKHGKIDGAGGHTIGEWLLLIESELAEAKLALVKGGRGRNAVRSEITQIAALCVEALEQHGLVDFHDRRQV